MKWTSRLLIAILLATGFAHAQGAAKRRPYIGYLCAAGGQRGTTFRMTAGGQNLRGARLVLVSGKGVHATVIRHRRVPWLLNGDQRRAVAQLLRRLANPRRPNAKQNQRQQKKKNKKKKPDSTMQEVPLPDHPMLKNLEGLTPKELRRLTYEFLDPGRRSQLSPQIAETVEIEVRIDPKAAPGERELRIKTPQGLTNPVLFQVGTLPETREAEPNDFATSRQPVLDLPCVLNGQVTFKDIDRFRFRARRGQKLVIEVQARRLVPYLADAVPGWFQATLALFDAEGEEIDFLDDYRFHPDPVLFLDVPADGEYSLEIRDAIYRGRDDFVYRVTVAERPYITAVFPLGGRSGSGTTAEILGWNVPWRTMRLDTRPSGGPIRQTERAKAGLRTNSVQYAVDKLRECKETEPNDSPRTAQRISLPVTVNGRISRAGEADVFRFNGRTGQEVVAEITARRLGSPLDSLLQLIDPAGQVIAFNDDHPDKLAGLVTHQADSYFRAVLPAAGEYLVRVTDAQVHGGDDHAYRLRVSPPRPDFAVIVTPASLNVRGGKLVPFTAHAVRRDGFDGEIELSLRDAPSGFALSGARIPAGRDSIRMTLAAPAGRRGQSIELEIVGRARIGRRIVAREAIPAEEMMQAFGLRHLVPAQRLLVSILRPWSGAPAMRLADDRRTRIPAAGKAEVAVMVPGLPPAGKVSFELSDPPPGVTLHDVRIERRTLILVFAAAQGKATVGLADNLIVEAYTDVGTGRRRGKGKGKAKSKPKVRQAPRRVLLGVLPAVPFVIIDGP